MSPISRYFPMYMICHKGHGKNGNFLTLNGTTENFCVFVELDILVVQIWGTPSSKIFMRTMRYHPRNINIV